MTNFLLLANRTDISTIDLALIITVVGFLIVVAVMIILAIVFIQLGKFMSRGLHLKRATASSTDSASVQPAVELKGKLSADTTAAIAAAIHMYMAASDDENTILTISRADKIYSPWSSKIYVTNRNIFNMGWKTKK